MLRVSSVVFTLVLSGCATYDRTKPAQHQTQPITVSYTAEELSGWSDLPIGTYRVPDSQVIISGHQKGSGVGVMFGLLGVAIEHSMEKSAGHTAVQNAEQILHITLTEEGQRDVGTLLQSDEFRDKFVSQGHGAQLTVSGAVIMTFIDDSNVMPFVVLRARLSPPKSATAAGSSAAPQSEPWWTRYICGLGAPKALTGDNSWTADGGVALRAAISAELARALHAALADVLAPAPRDESHQVAVAGYYPFVRGRFELVGYDLAQDEQSVVFAPRIGDVNVIAGVNIMDRTIVTTRPATKSDPVFKRLDGK